MEIHNICDLKYEFFFYMFQRLYDYIEFRCNNINKCNKTSAFPILKQYYTKLSFNFIIYSNEKSLSVNFTPNYLILTNSDLESESIFNWFY